MSKRHLRWGFAWLAGFMAVCALASAAELPSGFRLEPVVSGLNDPTALDASVDGRIFIAERSGGLRLIKGGELVAGAVCSVSVSTTGEAGLLGIALHPQFATNGWLYLYYTEAGGTNKVSRFTWNGSACVGGVDILPNLGGGASLLRNGGGMAFGPDGKLYVGVGDMEDGTNGQNTTTLKAKILRVNDDGSVPADNPTPGSLVFTRGVRDPKGVAVNSAGNVYTTDRGTDTGSIYDELDVARSGGNLGWDSRTGPSGGTFDDPLSYWLPVIGVQGLGVYGSSVFPDARADGKDNDGDKFGPDHQPGVARTDDNVKGECVGSVNNGLSCTSNANCPPRSNGFYNENAFCELRDDAAEYCPGGVPKGDDACGNTGAAGVDEPDESFINNLFFAAKGANQIQRTVLKPGALDQLSVTRTFLDSNFLADCPDNWTAVMPGRDGFLYAVATNSGGATGGLYRIIYDAQPGPREVSGDGSHFPLRVDKGATANDVVVYWEDLRSDATQPRDDGNADPNARQPQQPVREFTIWQGTLGTWFSHNPVVGFDKTQGTVVNDALRKDSFTAGSGSYYFLVSARHSDLEGTLGKKTDGTERPGYATKDICSTIGYHEPPGFTLWNCGRDFTIVDEYGETHSLYEYRDQVVLLDFSAIWCPPCQAEADVLENVWQLYKDRGVRFLTVLMDEDDQLYNWSGRPTAAECRNWSDRSGTNPDHTFPCWMDPVGGTQKAWPNYNKYGAIPTNVILDNGLRVVYSSAGYDEATIKDKLNRLVGPTDVCLQ